MKLKACWSCGVSIDEYMIRRYWGPGTSWRVVCESCGAQGPNFDEHGAPACDKEIAARLWNRRVIITRTEET